MEFCSDFKYDLKLGQIKEKELSDIFEKATIEVKTDLIAHKTGNLFIEYESRGQKSGLGKTEATYYCFSILDTFIIIPTNRLKVICRKYLGTDRDVLGGDNNTSKGILLPIKAILP